ncbi:MAG: iron-sulfur cluster assembly accessory protein [Deltaproteobacteria bacterium]|nr:iron-sulfur cluster assembly accessory protein [Deltaproteobacteria bacterium]
MAAGVSITDRAADKIKKIVAAENRDDQGLRVKVIGGGCSGLQYKLNFDNPRPGDRIFDKSGAKVIVDMKSLLYVNGTEVDHKESLMESGFVLQNPNIKRTCGCGASFTV